MKPFILVLLALVLVSSPALAFNGEWLGTLKWAPTDTTNVLDLLDEYNDFVDCVVVYSDSDVEMAIGHRRNSFTASVAQDSITVVLEDSHTVPSAGKVYQGQFKWLAAEAHTDTIYVDCYRRLAWPR